MNKYHYAGKILEGTCFPKSQALLSGLHYYINHLSLNDRLLMYIFADKMTVLDVVKDVQVRESQDPVTALNHLVKKGFVSPTSSEGAYSEWYSIEESGAEKARKLLRGFFAGSLSFRQYISKLDQDRREALIRSRSCTGIHPSYVVERNKELLSTQLFKRYRPVVDGDESVFKKIREGYLQYIKVDDTPEKGLVCVESLIKDPDSCIVVLKHTPIEMCMNAATQTNNSKLFRECFKDFVSERARTGRLIIKY